MLFLGRSGGQFGAEIFASRVVCFDLARREMRGVAPAECYQRRLRGKNARPQGGYIARGRIWFRVAWTSRAAWVATRAVKEWYKLDRRSLRLAHLTTVDMSLAILLETELETRVQEGVEVYGISAPGDFVPRVESLGVVHVPIPSFSRAWGLTSDLRAAWELYVALRRIRPHVLHTHTPKAGVLGRLVGWLAGVPVVVNTCHGLWATREDSIFKRALVIAAEVVAAQFSDAELYQNEDDRRRLSRWIRQSKTATVGNGIDLGRFKRDEEGRLRVRAEWGIGPEEIVIGGVGRRVAEKGLEEFATAAQALTGLARFVWVGPEDPDKRDAFRGDAVAVQHVGFREDMPAVYSAFDVFCLPSHREGFSRSGMEAGACGCVLVLSDIRGCRELGVHGQNLVLVPPGDARALVKALEGLLASPRARGDLQRAMVHHAAAAFDQRRIARHSWAAYRWSA